MTRHPTTPPARALAAAKPIALTMLLLTALTIACRPAPAFAQAGCPNEELRATLSSQLLPDCRAYELVTPPYKEGANPIVFSLSEDGSHMVIDTFGAFNSVEGDPIGATEEGANYMLSRRPSGWTASPIQPPESIYQRSALLQDVSSDDTKSLWELGTLDQPEEFTELYLRTEDGSITKIGPATVGDRHNGNGGGESAYLYLGASDDLSHVVFEITEADGGSFRWLPDESLYDYVGTGNTAPEPVGVLGERGSTSLISDCGARLGSSVGTTRFAAGSMYNAISASGARVFFTALGEDDVACGRPEPPVDELFAREEASDGTQRTVPVSEPSVGYCSEAPTTPCADAHFEGASRDGSKVFFTSTQKLLPGAGEGSKNLYEYDFARPDGERLLLLSAGSPTPEVQGVARISEDGSHVYFVARGVLTSSQNEFSEPAAEGQDNLYVYHEGTVSFIATLSPSDETDWSPLDNRPVQASTDGRYLSFTSSADLTAEGFPEGPRQVYLFDAQTMSLVRASIGRAGFNDNGETPTYNAALASGERKSYVGVSFYGIVDSPAAAYTTLSPEDGAVYFESPTGLTPRAFNNRLDEGQHPEPVENVYEYEAGHVYLLSDGRDASANPSGNPSVGLIGSSSSGNDVFFATADSLVTQDTDTQLDFYDARAGGGFAPPASLGCLEEACQGPLGAPASSPPPASEAALANGNVAPPPTPPPPGTKPKPTRAEQLRKALRACKKYRKASRRRVSCEKRARHKYAAKKASAPARRGT